MLASSDVLSFQEQNVAEDDPYIVSQDLMARANVARQQGNSDLYRKFVRAALDIVAEETEPAVARGRQMSPETTKIMELLKTGWQDVSQLSEATGLPANRVHAIIARFRYRSGDSELQTQAIKRYRLVPKT